MYCGILLAFLQKKHNSNTKVTIEFEAHLFIVGKEGRSMIRTVESFGSFEVSLSLKPLHLCLVFYMPVWSQCGNVFELNSHVEA